VRLSREIGGFAPINFHRILITIKVLPTLHTDLIADQPVKRLIDRLTVMLQSNSAAYFVARYDKAIREIRKFVELLVDTLILLPDEQLLEVAGMPQNPLARTEHFVDIALQF